MYPCTFTDLYQRIYERGRSLSCGVALCAKSMGIITLTVTLHNILTEMQLLGSGIWCFDHFKKESCFEK